jgi:phage terminase large subunit
MKINKEVNPHFEDFLFDWDSKFYFLVGGYGSSKSYHVGCKLILKLLQEKRTALVVREVYDTIRDSCYSLLEEIIVDLGLEDIVKFRESPMRVRFPNGSKIIFKGMDKPAKLKSINNVSIIWIEEASELKYAGFKELVGRLRHPTLSLHMILSENPVGKSNWTYKHFFKVPEVNDKELYKKRILRVGNTYYHHSLVDDNMFLPPSYTDELDAIKAYDPDLYRIARLGRFGINGTLVLPQFRVMPHARVMRAVEDIPKRFRRVGMDFGFESSYNAVLRIAIDDERKYLYIYWEYYKNHMTDDATAVDLEEFTESRELIRSDSAEPKTIKYYNQQGFRMVGAKKFQGSRLQNTKKVKRFKKIICSNRCVHTIEELQELTFALNKDGELIEDEFSLDPHTFSAIWYGLDGYEVADLKGGYEKFGIRSDYF